MILRARRLVSVYYLATPLFAALDFGLGLNVRLSGLDGHPWLRAAWYAVALACAALVTRRPELSSRVAAVEGGATVLALVLGVLVPYWDLVGRMAAEAPSAAGEVASLREGVANLILTGTVVAAARRRIQAG